MSIYLLIGAILNGTAFVMHTFRGDKILMDINKSGNLEKESYKITLARCGWHWGSIDLLATTILLVIINFTDFITGETILLQVLLFYFIAKAIVWFFTVAISTGMPNKFMQLWQWIFLGTMAILIYLEM